MPKSALIGLTQRHCRGKNVAVIRLLHPWLNTEARRGLFAALQQILGRGGDDEVNSVVVVGSGKVFSRGIDLVDYRLGRHNQSPTIRDIGVLVEQSRVPIIACLHGLAIGGGLELGLSCHWRVASSHKDTQIGFPEGRLMGLPPHAGASQRLPRLIGRGNALDLFSTARLLDAFESHKLGLVDEVVLRGGDGDDDEEDLLQALVEFSVSSAVSEAPLITCVTSMLPMAPRREHDSVNTTSAASSSLETIFRTAIDVDDFQNGLLIEENVFKKCLEGPRARALQYLYLIRRKQNIAVTDEVEKRMHGIVLQLSTWLLDNGWSHSDVDFFCCSVVGLSRGPFELLRTLELLDSESQARQNEPRRKVVDVFIDADRASTIMKYFHYPLVNEAFKILEEGIASTEEIDEFVCDSHRFGYPEDRGGLLFHAEQELKLADIVASLKACQEMHPNLPWLVPSKLLVTCVESGSSLREEMFYNKCAKRKT